MNTVKEAKRFRKVLPKMKVLNNSQLTKKTIGAAGGMENTVGSIEVTVFPTAYHPPTN